MTRSFLLEFPLVEYITLTPRLRERLAKGRSRMYLGVEDRTIPTPDAAIETALLAAPNATATRRATQRLQQHPAIFGAGTTRSGSTFLARFFTRIVGVATVVRFEEGSAILTRYTTPVLDYSWQILAWPKRYLAMRITVASAVVELHAISRFLERGPLDPRHGTDAEVRSALDRAGSAIVSAARTVHDAVGAGRLDPELAMTLPAPCPVGGGIWVIELVDSADGEVKAIAKTYVGRDQLSAEQQSFLTAADDGDIVAALIAYPDAIRREYLNRATRDARSYSASRYSP